jgi:CBS domain-containing protein
VAPLSEIMSQPVFSTASETCVAEVAEIMVRSRIGSAVVMMGPMLLGIFTERDVLRAAASGEDLNSSPVSQWMTGDPVTASPELDSEDAAELMLRHGFRHLPVLEGSAVVGIVSLRDLLSTRIRRPI